MIDVRPEIAADVESIRAVLLDAFPGPAEADLVEALRKDAEGSISLVAEEAGQIVGHIMFSPVTLEEKSVAYKMAGLAPMAVRSSHQRKGIGARLVKEGLKACQAEGYRVVVVLGHPEYYPRFGFEVSTQFGLKSQYDVSEEVFMAQVLGDDAVDGLAGTIVYHTCFQALE